MREGCSTIFELKKVLGPEEVESQTPWLSSALQAKLNVLGQAASLWGEL